MPQVVGKRNREHVETFIVDILPRCKPSAASNRYRALQVEMDELPRELERQALAAAFCLRFAIDHEFEEKAVSNFSTLCPILIQVHRRRVERMVDQDLGADNGRNIRETSLAQEW